MRSGRNFRLVVGLACCLQPAGAQWILSDGPHGPTVHALVASPASGKKGGTYLFGAHSRGVFLSPDTGATWSAADNGLPGEKITAIAVSSSSVGVHLFAGTEFDGIFHSIDDGRSWTAADKAPVTETERKATVLGVRGDYHSPAVLALAVVPSTDRPSLFAGVDFGGMYRSTDNGERWTDVSDGLSGSAPVGHAGVLAFASNREYLFAGTAGDGVFLSTNNGKKWINVSSGLPTDARSVYVSVQAFALSSAPDGSHGVCLLAGTAGGGVYRTTDDGRNWMAVNSGLAGKIVHSLVLSPNSSGMGGNNVFAGTERGVFLSTNDGRTWIAVNLGLPAGAVTALAVGCDYLFAGVFKNGVWRRSISEMVADAQNKQ